MNEMYNHADDFAHYCKAKGLSIKSIRSYEQTLVLFIQYMEREKGIQYISKITFRHLQERGKYTVVCNDYSALF